MSELLDRIRREIRERLDASRAAVLEHERLEAALNALGDAGSRATRAVRARGQNSRAAEAPPRSSGPGNPPTEARSSRQPSGPSSGDKPAARARAGGAASAPARRSSGAAAAGGRERARPSAGTRARSARAEERAAAPAAAAAPGRKRAARGANRSAVLRVIGERPGVTARELAAASQVTGGTLYTLLRRLTDDGTLEKRELPGGQAGYALASGATAQAADAQAATTAAAESRAAAAPAHERADSTQTADAARSVLTDAKPS